MFRSATFRLTMYYLAIIAVISIGFSVALYHVASHDLALSLEQQTRRISDNFPVFTDSPYLRFTTELDKGREHLLGQIVLWNIVVFIGAGFASYALARRTLQPIEAAHERQKRFTADVSHELRTPLTALKMESEVALLDTAASKADLKAVLRSNIEEAEKLTALVSNLLRLGQLDSADKAALMTAVPLVDAVTAAIDQVKPVADSRKIRLIRPASSEVAMVRGDQAMLAQLFIILLDNAIKYSPGNSDVSISMSQKNYIARVDITDRGNGIAKENLTHVFERFYRADEARAKSETSGFGLGLSIAKLIADSHGASIQLTSKLHQGTTATVFLPLTIANTPKAKAAQTPTPPTLPA